MEKPLDQLLQTLQRLIGLHRQLLDTVRLEHDALVQADNKAIQDAIYAKQALIEAIKQAESERLKVTAQVAMLWKKPLRDLSLTNIAIAIQGRDLAGADQLRSIFNALTVLIKRITEQNDENKVLVERSLEHLQTMKKNVLGESQPRSDVYTPKGQRANNAGNSRFVSKEA